MKKKSMLLKLTRTRIKKISKDQLITIIQIAVGAHGDSNSSSGFKYLVNYDMLHMRIVNQIIWKATQA